MNGSRWLCTGWLLFGFLAVQPSALTAPASDSGSVAAKPEQITVVADKNFPPFLFPDAEGPPRGYVADVWRLFQAHTGIRVKLVGADWGRARQMLHSGQADVIDAAFKTPEREAIWDFAPPYGTALPVSIYADQSVHDVHDLASLRGFTVGVQRDDACAEALKSAGHKQVRQFAYYADVVRAAAGGRLHAFCIDLATANYYLYLNSALKGFKPAFVLYSSRLHRAVLKGNASMLEVVERGMAQITPAEHKQLHERWLQHPSFAPWPYWRVLQIVVAVTLLVLVLMALWLWLTRRSLRARTRELRATRNRLQAWFNASPDAMSVKNAQGVYQDCNDRLADLFGRPRRDIVGHTDEALFDAAVTAEVVSVDQEVVRSGEPRVCVRTDPKGSEHRHFEVVKVPLFEADGTVGGILSVARDITERLRVEEDLRLWAYAFEYALFGVAIFDVHTRRITAANPTFAQERGYAAEEMVGLSVDVLYPEDLVQARRQARIVIDRQKHSVQETEQVTRSGRRFPVRLECIVTHDAQGEARHVIAYVRDLTEHKKTQNELRLAAVAFQSQAAIVVMDAQHRIQRINHATTVLFGYPAEDVLGQLGSAFRVGDVDQDVYEAAWRQAGQDGYWCGELWFKVKEGQPRIFRMSISAVQDSEGQVTHYVLSLVDMTRELEAHASVDRMTYFDRLTDLPNRNFLLGRLKHLLSETGSTPSALVLMDLDHFKRINDLRGHDSGDRLLLLVARRLHVLLGKEDALSRFSGGTFAFLVQIPEVDADSVEDYIHAYCERVLAAMREPFRDHEEGSITVTASIGWASLLSGQKSPDAVLRDVELAMYGAKGNGRDRVLEFDPSMREEMVRMETLTNELREAIAEQTLELHLQAQTDRAGKVTGAEMLLRWTRRCGEVISPALFIPIAEESGLILPIGDWVLQQACERLVAWSGDPLKSELSLAVNVSVKQFTQPGFVDGVRQILATTGADTSLLKLEITESVVLGDLDEAARKLRQLRKLGIRVSLDDFGTGYSSLAYLSHLPLDQLKIDQSFVNRLENDTADAMVAQTIIGMGHGLNLEVIAEGVETPAQHDFLLMQGCDAFQGYLLARPMALSQFERLLRSSPFLP